MEKAREVLRETFGFPEFRLSQEAVIRRLLEDNDNALVLYPTGGGKSLTYQIPALCLDGLTLVISPLISLMKDQVDSLVARGVKAASLDSTLTVDRSSWVKGEVLSGAMKILYVAPERLNNEGFVAMMSRVKISLLAVDESHCISQWGASFRPEYLKIARFAEELDVERVLCLTATATKDVAEDICKNFYIDPVAGVFRTSVYRPNLSFRVEVAQNLDEKLNRLIPLLKTRTGPAIVYVTLQKHAVEVADHLRPHGLEALVYHGGLPADEREKVQQEFSDTTKNSIVCATIAFGMGIDVANIRQVIHLYMPKTLENYSQEVGRAGRDGQPSTCLMFLSTPDIPVLEGFARGDTCSKTDMQLWLQEVALKAPASDGTLDFNLYEQSKTYDIRSNVLNLSYAQLELDYGYIRAVTPFYSIYEISARSEAGWKQVMSNNSPAAKIIRTYWSPRSGKYQIDVVSTARSANFDRSELAKQISSWEFDGFVDSKASQVRARYAVIKPLPKGPKEIQELVDQMYGRMLKREEEAIVKLRRVIEFATNDDCLAHTLATYFRDDNSVPDEMCGNCSFCTSGAGIEFTSTISTIPEPRQIQAILDACPERDDPRLLARMAFGITSPRLTAGKWSTYHPLFGSMVSVDFNALVAAFDVECKKAGYIKSESVPPVSKKRSYTSHPTTNSRGGGYKRPRRW